MVIFLKNKEHFAILKSIGIIVIKSKERRVFTYTLLPNMFQELEAMIK